MAESEEKNKDLPSLEQLESSIKEAKRRTSGEEENTASGGNVASAMRVGTELLADVGVGVFLGYHIDQWLGTFPWFFLICFCLGVAASVLNIYRITQTTKDT